MVGTAEGPKRIRSVQRISRQSQLQLNAPQCSTNKRQKSRKQWSGQSLLAAQEAVRQGMSVNRTAAVHGVATTINLIIMIDTQSGRVKHGTKLGPIPYLDQLL